MKKFFILLILLSSTLFFGPLASVSLAVDDCGVTPSSNPKDNPPDSITLGKGQLLDSKKYDVCFYEKSTLLACAKDRQPSGGYITIDIKGTFLEPLFTIPTAPGELFIIKVLNGTVCESTYTVTGAPPPPQCKNVQTDSTHYEPGETINANGTTENITNGVELVLVLRKPDNSEGGRKCIYVDNNNFQGELQAPEGVAGNWRVDVQWGAAVPLSCVVQGSDILCSSLPSHPFTIYSGTPPPIPPTSPTAGGCDQCGWCDKDGNGILDDKDPKPDYWDKCIKCVTPKTDDFPEGVYPNGGAYTALGCIDVSPQGFISWLLQRIIGIAGGIAFLLILYGGFQILTSTGDPEKLTSGKDIVVSAIAGLLMIIFSVLLLRIIGVDILQIPGFGQ